MPERLKAASLQYRCCEGLQWLREVKSLLRGFGEHMRAIIARFDNTSKYEKMAVKTRNRVYPRRLDPRSRPLLS